MNHQIVSKIRLYMLSSFFINLLAVVVIAAEPDTTKPIDVEIYCDDAYRPYSYANEKGEASGIYSDILREASKTMPEYRITLKPIPWIRAMEGLKNNDIFAVYPPYYRPQERPFIGEYSEPILEESIVVYTRKEILKSPRVHFPDDWHGLKVGIFLGTMDIAGPRFATAVSEGKIKMKEYKGNEKNILALLTGDVDAYVKDRLAIKNTIRELKESGKWPVNAPELVEGVSISKDWGHLAFTSSDRKFPYKKDFVKKMNLAIRKLKKDKSTKKIVSKYS